YGMVATWWIFMLPLFMLIAFLTALAFGLWLSALNVRYRDVGYTLPFLIQIWMYASPIVYPLSIVPEKWRQLYSLNPMVSVIEGFRWAMLGNKSPDFTIIAVSTSSVLLLLMAGIVFFRRMERTFADVM
ncbi:unnamed protein product, partial [marine sediment metagenome]